MTETKSRKGIGGPKTPEGRRRVSLNAIKHGHYAKTEQAMELLTEKVGRDYNDLLEELRAHFRPLDPLEELLVRRIARAAWRTFLTEAVENKELVKFGGMPGLTNNYENMIRNERYIDIQLHRALYALERKRAHEKILRNKLLPSGPQSPTEASPALCTTRTQRETPLNQEANSE